MCIHEREDSNDFSKTKQGVSDLTLQIKYLMCAAQGFDYWSRASPPAVTPLSIM